jgi:hypothetical protein
MLATLSPESKSLKLMRELGVSHAFVSALCHIEQTKLSYAFRGLKALPQDEGRELVETLERLAEIQKAVAPLTIDLTNPVNTRLVLEAFFGQNSEVIKEKMSVLFNQ